MLTGTVGSYQVWGRLSQGGMSDVWLARHTHLALPVVIKTMRAGSPGAQTLEERYQRLLDEARLTARLTSPRVVRVIDVGVHRGDGEDAPYLVEEYVDGMDLAELDRRRRAALRRRLPLWLVADFVAQAAEGLHVAHQNGVIHRDVKPQNLFGYGHGQVKLGDFGVAVTSYGETSLPAGTPLFMAPEQLAGERIDRRADIYGLGATAYALRYGVAPFTAAELRKDDRVLTFPPARGPEEAYFQHVVAKMLAYRPEQRQPHLGGVRHHLHAIARATVPHTVPTRTGDNEFQLGPTRIRFEVGDIARADAWCADTIISSANSSMTMRQGVGDALRRRGGDALEAEAMAGGERALGDCVLTGPGTLPVKGVIHAVGAWNEVSCIARATQRALLIAEQQGFRKIAVPALGTGQGRVALEACIDAMVASLHLHLSMGGALLEDVCVVLYDAQLRKRALDVAAGILLGSAEAALLHDDDGAVAEATDSYASTLFGSASGAPPGAPAAATASTTVGKAVGGGER